MKRILIVLLLCGALVFFFGSCKKKVQTGPVVEPEPVEKVEEAAPKIEKPTLSEEELFEKQSLEEINRQGYLRRINYDFDRYFIREDMKPILQKNADWLLKFASVVITIEGHCDERGTIEYNMALGEKRAKSAQNYLLSLGVPALRIQTISYGKSKPSIPGAVSEDDHFKNRRAEFVIIKK